MAQTAGSGARIAVGWNSSPAARQTLQGMLAGLALRSVVEDFSGPGVDQPHIAGIGDAPGQPQLRNQRELLLNVYASRPNRRSLC